MQPPSEVESGWRSDRKVLTQRVISPDDVFEESVLRSDQTSSPTRHLAFITAAPHLKTSLETTRERPSDENGMERSGVTGACDAIA